MVTEQELRMLHDFRNDGLIEALGDLVLRLLLVLLVHGFRFIENSRRMLEMQEHFLICALEGIKDLLSLQKGLEQGCIDRNPRLINVLIDQIYQLDDEVR